MKNIISTSRSYLRVGYLLHIVTILEIFILTALYDFFDLSDWVAKDQTLLRSLLVYPFVVMPFFPQLDARSRFQNYKQLKDQFYLYGFDLRIVRPFIKSRCQRDAARVAASELGLGEICNRHFHDKGYRWFHLLPDYLFTNPKFLLCKAFWITTFFAKTYRSRIDFSQGHDSVILPSTA
ncbi:MAG: hypothetical protein JWN76_2531 [Chitinophagaceae bacterium]|nr:hypothetical protein [Chitinophagaceae bacterium]